MDKYALTEALPRGNQMADQPALCYGRGAADPDVDQGSHVWSGRSTYRKLRSLSYQAIPRHRVLTASRTVEPLDSEPISICMYPINTYTRLSAS